MAMMTTSGSGHHPQAGAFGRRALGRATPSRNDMLEVDEILDRCRRQRISPYVAPATKETRQRPERNAQDAIAYFLTGVSLLALSVVSVLPVF